LNEALDLSLEWGEHFLEPINERIRARHPELSTPQAEALNQWCNEVRRLAFELVKEEYFDRSPHGTAKARIRERYPEITEELLGRLQNQGTYFAWHG
jgi:hypothetical protein